MVQVSAGSNPLSESEMDAHTIRCMRDEAAENEHLHPKALIYAKPSDSFHSVRPRSLSLFLLSCPVCATSLCFLFFASFFFFEMRA